MNPVAFCAGMFAAQVGVIWGIQELIRRNGERFNALNDKGDKEKWTATEIK